MGREVARRSHSRPNSLGGVRTVVLPYTGLFCYRYRREDEGWNLDVEAKGGDGWLFDSSPFPTEIRAKSPTEQFHVGCCIEKAMDGVDSKCACRLVPMGCCCCCAQ